MAFRVVSCPQCGGEVQIEDYSADYAECRNCGAQIQLKDIQKIEYTGQVKLDNTKEGYNRLHFGDMAFEAKNYQEAYDFYKEGLVYLPNKQAFCRKGICAAYISEPCNLRIAELEAAIKEALNTDDVQEPYSAEGMDKDLTVLLEYYEQLNGAINTVYTNEEECAVQVLKWRDLSALYNVVSQGLKHEDKKESVLLKGIDFCDKVTKESIPFMRYKTTVVRNEEIKEKKIRFYADKNIVSEIGSNRSEMANRYNELPSRIAKREKLERDLSESKKELDSREAAKKEAETVLEAAKECFWINNKESKKKMELQKNLSWISIVAGVLALIVTIVLREQNGTLPMIGAGVFVLSIVLKVYLSRMITSKYENNVLPDDVKALQAKAKKATDMFNAQKKEFSMREKALKAFEKSNK